MLIRVLGLPGQRAATQDWLQRLLQHLALPDAALSVQRYQCWEQGPGPVDIATEARRARESLPDLVIAKSAGTMVALQAASPPGFSAKACVFIGTPVNAYGEHPRAMLRALAERLPLLLIQQNQDPTGPCASLRAVMADTPARIEEIAGSDHAYGDLDVLRDLIQPWWREIR